MTAYFWNDDVDHHASELRSLLADRGGFFSSNPCLGLADIPELRVQLLAAVLLELWDGKCSRWALIEEDLASPGSGRWHFPCAVFEPGQMPLSAALGTITEQLILLDRGVPSTWAGLSPSVLSVGLDWLPELRVPLRGACQVEWTNTLVFTYHARRQVPDVHQIEVCDGPARQSNRIWLAGIADIQSCVTQATLCPTAERLWASYWQAND